MSLGALILAASRRQIPDNLTLRILLLGHLDMSLYGANGRCSEYRDTDPDLVYSLLNDLNLFLAENNWEKLFSHSEVYSEFCRYSRSCLKNFQISQHGIDYPESNGLPYPACPTQGFLDRTSQRFWKTLTKQSLYELFKEYGIEACSGWQPNERYRRGRFHRMRQRQRQGQDT